MDNAGATVVRFRTALAGFHKGDVTEYISQNARTNREMINNLNQQIQDLQRENDQLRSNAMDGDYVAELEAKAAALAAMEQENTLLKNRVRQLEFKLEEAETAAQEVPVVPAVLEEPKTPQMKFYLQLPQKVPAYSILRKSVDLSAK